MLGGADAWRGIAVCAALVGASLSCGDVEPEPAAPEPVQRVENPRFFLRPPGVGEGGRWREFHTHRFDRDLDDEQRRMIDELEAIGYLSGSSDAPEVGGVVRYDTSAAEAGANFYVSGHAPEAVLIDMRGNELHRWRFDFWQAWPEYPVPKNHPMTEFWRRAYLYPNGDILAVHEGLGILKLDRDSKLVWAVPNRAHHDIEVTENGDIFVLGRVAQVVPRIHPRKPILEDFVIILEPNGEEKRRISLLGAFEGTPFAGLARGVVGRSGDIFHTNTLAVLRGRAGAADPAFRAGNVLTYMLAIGVVAVLDLDTEKIVWARRAGPLLRHDPSVTAEGNLLIFENQIGGNRSRVVEYEGVSTDLRWSFEGDETRPFYSATCGTAERLPGGNTLVTESDAGRAFEVSPEGEIVWEFVNPHRAGPENRYIATLFEVSRLSEDFSLDWVSRQE